MHIIATNLQQCMACTNFNSAGLVVLSYVVSSHLVKLTFWLFFLEGGWEELPY